MEKISLMKVWMASLSTLEHFQTDIPFKKFTFRVFNLFTKWKGMLGKDRKWALCMNQLDLVLLLKKVHKCLKMCFSWVKYICINNEIHNPAEHCQWKYLKLLMFEVLIMYLNATFHCSLTFYYQSLTKGLIFPKHVYFLDTEFPQLGLFRVFLAV